LKKKEFNLEEYRPHLEEYDMTRHQKLEFLEALRGLLARFVDAAFDPEEDNWPA
jgi:hypothetical protein